MPSSRQLAYSVAFIVTLFVSQVGATEAAKLLPADTKVVVTLNLRQILSDHGNTEFVQRYLDQWRLALKGDERQVGPMKWAKNQPMPGGFSICKAMPRNGAWTPGMTTRRAPRE